MKTIELIICCFLASGTTAYLLGLHYQKELAKKTEIMGAYADMLHVFYAADHDFWKENIIPTEQYHRLDSLVQGDWEDFYLY